MARKRSKKRNIYLDIADAVTAFGLKLGGLVFVLVLGYLVYALVTKNGLVKIGELPPADQARVISNIGYACKILGVSGAVLAICIAIRYYFEETLGYLMSLLGVVLYIGAPWALLNWFGQPGPVAKGAIGAIIRELRLLGVIFFAPGAVLVVRDLVLRFRTATAETQKKDSSFLVGEQPEYVEEPYRSRLYARCWQMPYCRGFMRKACPCFELNKSCWKRKSGCMCDGAIIERALRSQSSEGRLFMRDLQYRLGNMPKKTELTAAEKRARCRTCIIYDFHQKQKYKIVSPLVFPIVLGLIWALYQKIEAMVLAAVGLTDQFMHTISLLPQPQGTGTAAVDVPEIVLILFVVWLAIVSVSYALHFVEFCIFKIRI